MIDYDGLNLTGNTLTLSEINLYENILNGVTLSNFDINSVLTSLTQPQADDNTIATSKAIQEFLTTTVADSNHFRGSWDASSGNVPTIDTGSGINGTIVAGDWWRVSVGGTIPLLLPNDVVDINDVIIAISDITTQGEATGTLFISVNSNMLEASADEAIGKTGIKYLTARNVVDYGLFKTYTYTANGVDTIYNVQHDINIPLEGLSIQCYATINGVKVPITPLITGELSPPYTTLTIESNPPIPAGEFTLLIKSGVDNHYVAPPIGLTNIALIGQQTIDLNMAQTYTPFFISPDGLGYYTSVTTAATLVYLPLTVPWDITSVDLNGGKSINLPTGEVTSPYGIWFDSTGTKMFVGGWKGGGLSVIRYDLSVAWDITTYQYPEHSSTIIESPSGVQPPWLIYQFGIRLSENMDTLFVFTGNGYVRKYSLSTPGDLNSRSVSAVYSNPSSSANWCISNDGNSMYYLENTPMIIRYDLATPFDETTAIQPSAYNSSNFYTFTSPINNPHSFTCGIFTTPNGLIVKFGCEGTNSILVQFTL